MSRKIALIIGNSEYDDKNLARLVTPDTDVSALASILQDAEIGGFDEVTPIINTPAAFVLRAIARLFAGKKLDDLLLMYFSGHGVRDDQGNLYLAVKDTEHDLLSATAIPAAFITAEMDRSRSRRQVLILDCCHSGAFARGAKGAVGGRVGTAAAFAGTGYGRVVLTASDSTQYSWEGDQIIGHAENSVFTHYLIQGLQTGEADIDTDGRITIDELYDYVYEQVVNKTPKQTPGKWSYKQQGEIVIARNPCLILKPAELPPELQQAIDYPLAEAREGAVRALDTLLYGMHKSMALAAEAALKRLAEDDSRRVSTAARESLARYAEFLEAERRAAKQAKIDALLREAQKAATEEDWQTAIEKYQQVLELEPQHAQAKSGLSRARLEQELADLYAQGQEHYEARRWPQALECLRRVLEIRAHYKQVDELIAAIERAREEQNRRDKITMLLRETKEAMVKEHWRMAIEKYQAVLDLEATHAEAKAGLSRALQEQELADLYAQGQEHNAARRWPQALDCLHRIKGIRPHYQQVNELIAAIERAREEQNRREKVTALLREAKEADAKEDWQTATEKYQAVLELEPNHVEAKAGLSRARHEQELADLYAQGQAHYTAKRWSQALDCLRRVQKMRAHYKRVDDLIPAIERAQDEQNRHDKAIARYREAQAAMAIERWQAAAEKLQAVLALEPDNVEAKAGLERVQDEIALANLLAEGRKYLDTRQWDKAVGYFRQVEAKRPGYKNSKTLLETSEWELAQAQKAKTLKPPEPAKPSQKRRPKSAVVILAASTVIVAALAIFLLRKPSVSLEAEVTIATEPEGVRVIVDEDSIGTTPISNFKLAAGLHSFRLRKQHYFSIDTSIVLKENQPLSFSFTLKPAAGVSLEIDPPAAEVILDGRMIESAQLVNLALPVGEHRISISAEGYEPHEDRFSLSQGVNSTLKYSLEKIVEPTIPSPEVGGIRITSEPSGASVRLNGKFKGTTPYQNSAIPTGRHQLQISQEGYEDSTTTITVQRAQTISVAAKLAALGGLEITSNPSGASIFLDGVDIGLTPKTIPEVKVGEHKVVLRKESHNDYSTSVTVVHQQMRSVHAELSILFGKLKVLVKPYGSIYIDGKLHKKDADRQYVTDLPAGLHRLIIEHPTFGIWEEDKIEIKPDRLREVTIDFNRTVTITIAATPVWADIYVDRQSTGYQTPRELTISIGRHTIEVRRTGYVVEGGARVINLEEGVKEHLVFTLKKVR